MVWSFYCCTVIISDSYVCQYNFLLVSLPTIIVVMLMCNGRKEIYIKRSEKENESLPHLFPLNVPSTYHLSHSQCRYHHALILMHEQKKTACHSHNVQESQPGPWDCINIFMNMILKMHNHVTLMFFDGLR
jgi:hypothetical protein